MAKKYFRYIPDFDYVSRLSKAQNISDYIRVKNLFKRTKISEEIFSDLTFFTKYQIITDERPDNVAYKIYGDSNLDWMVLLSNNIINLQQEWPLEHQSYYNYLINKYGSDAALQNIHHYETREIKNSLGKIVVPKGLEVPSTFTITFFDVGLGVEQTISTEIVTEITNEIYENRINDGKRNINLIKPKFVGLVIDEIEKAMKYPKGTTQYVSKNVVKDPSNPQNEGRVFLYKYGKKIFDKIMDVMQPEFEDETPINPFDLWAGANFKLKIVKKDGFWNYDKSEFDSPNPLLEDDDALEAVWKKEFSLTAFTANDQFKTYDELKTRLDYVLGAKAKLQVAQETEYDNYAAQETKKVTEEEVLKKLETSYQESKAVETVNTPSSTEEEEDPLSYFAKLAES